MVMLVEKGKRRAGILALWLALVGAITACKHDTGVPAEAPAAAPVVSAPASPAIDRALDDRLAFIAGLATGSPSYSALEAEPAWRDFAKAADKAWAEFDSAVLEPMRTWAASDLPLARERTVTLF
ncbi:MAG: hypothetical protein H6P96_701, partial [Candidatus Aminicenantes bacterium]|nr:hypothetical protein [Candidatus Aminicenantes bacterium]